MDVARCDWCTQDATGALPGALSHQKREAQRDGVGCCSYAQCTCMVEGNLAHFDDRLHINPGLVSFPSSCLTQRPPVRAAGARRDAAWRSVKTRATLALAAGKPHRSASRAFSSSPIAHTAHSTFLIKNQIKQRRHVRIASVSNRLLEGGAWPGLERAPPGGPPSSHDVLPCTPWVSVQSARGGGWPVEAPW